jgi:hypothetical protein
MKTSLDRIASDATGGLSLVISPALSDNDCDERRTPAMHQNLVADSSQYLMHLSMKAYR